MSSLSTDGIVTEGIMHTWARRALSHSLCKERNWRDCWTRSLYLGFLNIEMVIVHNESAQECVRHVNVFQLEVGP